jgi:2-polyprenyl-3-methyl-5-hydroxy-6-metoxy-1,4-benzoquinol methylase
MASLRQLLKSGAYWRKKLISGPSLAGEPAESGADAVYLNVDRIVSCEFGEVSDACRQATMEVLELLRPGGYENLARHSPGLNGFAWQSYISLSILRLGRVARALKANVRPSGKVLDFGSYFGNAALLAKKLGFEVSALDCYDKYAPALKREREHLTKSGIEVFDSSQSPTVLDDVCETFDAILLLGVIEHIPHTPKYLLQHICTHLTQGGLLILDTPNLGYIYRREALLRGESVFLDIKHQFHTELPFEGHHREYTRDEVIWMLNEVGLSVLETELFNYSLYTNTRLNGEDARRYEEMILDESKREVIFITARKEPIPRLIEKSG